MRRWRRTAWTATVLRFVPYVRLVGLNGSMVTGDMHAGSDIDFFLVLQEGRIFSGRVFVTVVVQLLGLRRQGSKVAGRICLNRYATTSWLTIGPPNLYHARVFHNLVPLFSAETTYARYLETNAWMAHFDYPVVVHKPLHTDSWLSWLVRSSLEGLADMLFLWWSEPLLRNRQLWRLRTDPRVSQPGSRVVVSDQELCFHILKNA